mmetsp:Transcript_7595/g.21591  ORF Transcript_7595/g.21591 Transcript_7595/m.21591 type:complete len:145 (+) Transcript_7595:69-503(+)
MYGNGVRQNPDGSGALHYIPKQLIVCSKTVMCVWKLAKLFGDHLRVLYYHRDHIASQFQAATEFYLRKYHVVVTTYDVVRQGFDEDNFYCNSIVRNKKGGIEEIRERTPADMLPCRNESGPWLLHNIYWNFRNPKTITFRLFMK